MKKTLLAGAVALVVAIPLLALAFAPAPDAGSRPVNYKTWHGYAESRQSGLKGNASFLALTARSEFYGVFQPVLTPRGAPDPIPKDAFDAQLFVAVIKRDGALWEYKVEKVTANGETLTVSYRATPRGGATTERAAPFDRSTRKVETRVIETRKTVTTEKAAAVPAETRKAEPAKIETKRVETMKAGGFVGTARAAAPAGGAIDSALILSVPKGKYATVVFTENGQKAGSVRVGN